MDKLHTPSQVEAFTGLGVGAQRAWARQGFLDRCSDFTEGGHRRFRDADVLFIAVTRAIGTMGIDLEVASKISDTILVDVVDSIQKTQTFPIQGTHPFVLVWPAQETRDEAMRTYKKWLVSAGDFNFIRLYDLNRAPFFAKFGGFFIFPKSLWQKLPQAVLDLFGAQP